MNQLLTFRCPLTPPTFVKLWARRRLHHSAQWLLATVLVITGLWLPLGTLYAQSPPVRMSTPLPTFAGDVEEFANSADGRFVVYLADHDQPGTVELYSVESDAGEPVKLNAPLPEGMEVASFRISADSTLVVYKTQNKSTDTRSNRELENSLVVPEPVAVESISSVALTDSVDTGVHQPVSIPGPLAEMDESLTANAAAFHGMLYSVAITGGPVAPLVAAQVEEVAIIDYAISPDGQYVLYRADLTGGDQYQLYSVPVLGGASTQLNGQLTRAGDVSAFQISPDSTRVVYFADQDFLDSSGELYSVPINGGVAILLSDLLLSTSYFFQISPDGQFVYFIQDDKQVMKTPLAGGTRTRLNDGPLPVGWGFRSLRVSADGNHLVYRVDAEQQGKYELYSLASTGGIPVKLNPPLDRLGNVGGGNGWLYPENYAITPDNQYVVYLVDIEGDNMFDLYSSPLNGGTAIKLNPPLPELSNAGTNFKITRDSAEVIFGIYGYYTSPHMLYRTPVGGGEASLVSDKLLGDFWLSGDDQQIIYRGVESTAGSVALYMRSRGDGEAVQLNGPLAPGGTVQNDFVVSSNGDYVLYRAEQELAGVVELYQRALAIDALPRKLSDASQTATFFDIISFEVSSDNRYLVYLTAWEADHRLYAVALGGGEAYRLDSQTAAAGKVERFELTPDGNHVVFRSGGSLYSTPIGGGAPTQLDSSPPDDANVNYFRISPDNQWVVFRVGRTALFSTPVTGGHPNQLNGPLPPGGDIGDPDDPFPDFQISPDSQRVVYRADQDTFDVLELYSVPIAGGSPVKLNPLLSEGAEVGGRDNNQYDFLITPDGSSVVYRVYDRAQYASTLYQTALLGGSALKLSQADFDVTDFRISPDSTQIVYRVSYGRALYRVPLFGGLSVQLNAPLPNSRYLAADYSITGDGLTVLYRVDQELEDKFELYAAPMAGGYPIRLNPPLTGQRSVDSFALSHDGQIAVYLMNQAQADQVELYTTPVAGGSTTLLNAPVAANEQIEQYQISPDNSYVVYQIARHQTGEPTNHALYVAPIQGGEQIRLTTAQKGDRDCYPACYQITSNSSLILFLAQPVDAVATELYAALSPQAQRTYLPLIQPQAAVEAH